MISRGNKLGLARGAPFKERYGAKNIVREIKGFLKRFYILTNLLPRGLDEFTKKEI